MIIFNKNFLENKIFFKGGGIIRAVTNPIRGIFGRRHRGDSTEVIEQTQKVEVQYRDPPPDKDYIKLGELARMIVPFEMKGDISSVNSSYLLAHFGVNRPINLTNEPRLKWTLFGYSYASRQTYNLKSLIGKNYDKSWLPDNSSYGTLIYNAIMDRIGKVNDFKELHDFPISHSWQSGPFECRRAFFVQSIGTTVNVYSRVYKRIGYTSSKLPPVPATKPKPREINLTITCIINAFFPNRNEKHLIRYIRTNDGHNANKWYTPNNTVRISIKVPYGTVFNVNKLTYHNTLSPANCPQITCSRDESVTYSFNYNPRFNFYAYQINYISFTENYNWVAYVGSVSQPFTTMVKFRRERNYGGKSGEDIGRS